MIERYITRPSAFSLTGEMPKTIVKRLELIEQDPL